MGKKKKMIKQPVTTGTAKVPVIMQMEALECGAASLTMILAYYEKWIPLEQVRADCGVSRDGSNAKNILRAARNYGLNAKGYRYEPEDLKKNGKFVTPDYSIISFDYISDTIVTSYRKKLHCFRHATKEAIKERGTYTEEQKNFFIDYGLTLIKVIHTLVN